MSTLSQPQALRFRLFRFAKSNGRSRGAGRNNEKIKDTPMTNVTTKKELQHLIDQIGEKVSDMLNPVFTREQLIEQVQELDELVNNTEEEEDNEEEFEDDED
jgi:hypothetical protein